MAPSLKVRYAAALLEMGRSHSHAKLLHADQIISLFHADHFPIRKVDGGPDEPWNIVHRFIKGKAIARRPRRSTQRAGDREGPRHPRQGAPARCSARPQGRRRGCGRHAARTGEAFTPEAEGGDPFARLRQDQDQDDERQGGAAEGTEAIVNKVIQMRGAQEREGGPQQDGHLVAHAKGDGGVAKPAEPATAAGQRQGARDRRGAEDERRGSQRRPDPRQARWEGAYLPTRRPAPSRSRDDLRLAQEIIVDVSASATSIACPRWVKSGSSSIPRLCG